MKKLIILLSCFLSLNTVQADQIQDLSPGLRALLSQEMIAIEKGMHSIFSSIISGDYENISLKAEQIQNSFILKQKLSPSQRKELQAKLPQTFISLDRGFHQDAGELVNAAEFEDKKLVHKYYYKMMQTCVQCHSTYAKSRFRNFQD